MTGLSPRNIRLVEPQEQEGEDIIVENDPENGEANQYDDKGNLITIEHDDGSISISLSDKPLLEAEDTEIRQTGLTTSSNASIRTSSRPSRKNSSAASAMTSRAARTGSKIERKASNFLVLSWKSQVYQGLRTVHLSKACQRFGIRFYWRLSFAFKQTPAASSSPSTVRSRSATTRQTRH